MVRSSNVMVDSFVFHKLNTSYLIFSGLAAKYVIDSSSISCFVRVEAGIGTNLVSEREMHSKGEVNDSI